MNKDLFGLYYVIYDDVIKGMEQKKYGYMDTENFIHNYVEQLSNGDIRESQKIYWTEILLRVHFTAVTSLIRAKKWLYGVQVGLESANLMVFSSSLRGYLESVVDTYYSLEALPCGLAINYKKIKEAIDGKQNYAFMSNEIESKLLHFQFARRGRNLPEDKKALTNTEYINSFDLDGIGVKKLYSELCEITHPASNSVNCFSREEVVSEVCTYCIIDEDADREYIDGILEKYEEQIKHLLQIDISLNGICLKILNLFQCDAVYTSSIEESIFTKIINSDAWDKIIEMMEKGEDYLIEQKLEKVVLW